ERVGAIAAFGVAVLPAEALLLDRSGLWLGTDVLGIDCPMGLADRVAADDERKGLLVVHRHATEGLSNVLACKGRVRVAAGPLRIHVDQTHVISGERPLELPLAGVALVAKPGVLRAPEDLVGLPAVLAPEGEAE